MRSAASPPCPAGSRARSLWNATRASPGGMFPASAIMKCSGFSRSPWSSSKSISGTTAGRRGTSAFATSTSACADSWKLRPHLQGAFPSHDRALPRCVDLVEQFRRSGGALPGWRKAKAWRRQLKNLQRTTSQIVARGGPNQEARVKSAVQEYLAAGRGLEVKVRAGLLALCGQPVDLADWEALEYFHRMPAKHLDLVARRLLHGEKIPPPEKVFSLFEPHTEWIQKGKQRPNVELGHKLLLATDQQQLIQDYAVLLSQAEVDQSIPVTDRLLGRYGAGSVAGVSFDKAFTRTADRELLGLYVPTVVMPKRGKKNAAERERESGKNFAALRQQQ